MATPTNQNKIDRLLDAIECIEDGRKAEGRMILRQLIRDDNDFEHAWLWMSVAVDSIDQAMICLDNVLRINPSNIEASTALYRLRMTDRENDQRREHLRTVRDLSLLGFWALFMALLVAIMYTSLNLA